MYNFKNTDHNDNIILLFETVRKLSLELDFEKFFMEAVKAAIEVAGGNCVSGLALLEEDGSMGFKYLIGTPEYADESVLKKPFDEETKNKIISKRAGIVFFQDYQNDPNAIPAFKEVGLKSVLSFPVYSFSKAIGFLSFGWFYKLGEPLAESKINVIEAIIEQIAVAYQRKNMIDELKHLNKETNRISNLYNMLSQINELVFSSNNNIDMLYEVCSVIVKFNGFHCAWIGFIDEKFIIPVAYAGLCKDDFDKIKFPVDKIYGDNSISSVVMADQDKLDKLMLSGFDGILLNAAKYHSFKSLIAVPFYYVNSVCSLTGILAIYSSEENIFKDKEIKLVEQISASVSKAIKKINSENKQAYLENSLHYLAVHDWLTGVFNRSFFTERTNQAIESVKRNFQTLALAVCDLDGFKKINDRFGHSFGDELLKIVANILKDNVRKIDTVVRFGGDEFAVLFEDVGDKNDIYVILERILSEFKSPVTINEKEIIISISIGLSFYAEADTINKLYKNADLALYEAKNSGGNRYIVYEGDITAKNIYQMELIEKLKSALINNKLTVYYQPVINIFTNEIVELEALLRWNDPVEGFKSAYEFLPFIKHHSIVEEMTYNLFQKALNQQKNWNDSGFKSRISVNISPYQFYNAGFIDNMIDFFTCFFVKPGAVMLEISEDTLKFDFKKAVDISNKLIENNAAICLDDFCLRYGSINYLTSLPISEIKIDRNFIYGASEDKKIIKAVQGLLAIGNLMDIRVIIKGVESQTDYEILRQIGCNFVQGYYFAKPMDGKDIPGFYKSFESKYLLYQHDISMIRKT